MNCKEFENLLADAVGDELSDEDRARFESHIASCETCRREFASLASAVTQLGTLPAPPQVSIRHEGGRLVIGDAVDGAGRAASVPTRRPSGMLRFAASILIAFTAGYGMHAGMMMYGEASGVPVVGVDGNTRLGGDEPASVAAPAHGARMGHRHGSFRAAFAQAHLAAPGQPALAQCLMAMAGGE